MTQEKYNTLNNEERELIDEIGIDEVDDNAEFVKCSHCGRLMVAETEEHYTHLGCLCDECYGDLYD